MKRAAREMDLRLVAHDMQLALRGAPPDAMTMLLANTTDPILDALKNRPELILTMMQLSAQINKLWSAVPDLWVTLIDQLILHDYGVKTLYTYAFSRLQQSRWLDATGVVRDKFDWAALDAMNAGTRFSYRPHSTVEFIDDVIKSYSLHSVVESDAFHAELGSTYYSGVLAERYISLVECVNRMAEVGGRGRAFSLSDSREAVRSNRIRVMGDCLSDRPDADSSLINRLRDTVEAIANELNRYSHGPMLGATVEFQTTGGPDGRTVSAGFFAIGVAQALDALTSMANSLLYALRQVVTWAESVPAPNEPTTTDARLRSALDEVHLTEETSLVFHRTLWHDVYKEPAQQREHLFQLMRARREKEERQKRAEEWERGRAERDAFWKSQEREQAEAEDEGDEGPWVEFDIDSPLRCTACGLRTEHVDTRTQLPFCTDSFCGQLRALYPV